VWTDAYSPSSLPITAQIGTDYNMTLLVEYFDGIRHLQQSPTAQSVKKLITKKGSMQLKKETPIAPF
jgi:hypothetical protein